MSQADRTERLLNLLFALMASARPVPKHVLRDAIDAYRASPSDEAFERMFERDKEELRSMGVPILTVEGFQFLLSAFFLLLSAQIEPDAPLLKDDRSARRQSHQYRNRQHDWGQ